MGWCFYHRDKGETNAEHFGKDWPSVEILADSTVKGVWYAACKKKDTGEVFAAVFLTKWVPNDHFNFGYKSMDETMGPGDTDAPAKVLDLLTPTDSEWANQWRAKCRETIAAKVAAKETKKKVTKDTVIVVEHQLFFGKRNGYAKRFRYTGDKNIFVATELGIRVNLGTDWPRRSFTVETPQEVTA